MGMFAALAPSVISGVAGLIGNSSSNKSAAKAAQAQNEFTEGMMKNRHQWETADLEKAGLNRILSATNGAPSMGSSAKAEVFDKTQAMQEPVKRGLEAMLMKAQIKNLESQSVNQLSSAASADANAALARANTVGSDQWNAIKKPASDFMRGVGDVTSSAVSGWRKFQSDSPSTRMNKFNQFWRSTNPLKLFGGK